MDLNVEKLAKMIDHTVLKPETTQSKIKQLCDEAVIYDFAAVCINPVHAVYAAELLKDTSVKVCVVVGFPLGATTPEVKAFETKTVVSAGAHEVDMVMNIGAMRDENFDLVKRDIESVVSASGDAHVKVILETGFFKDDQKRKACLICKEAGADFVKTSTGFGPMGATPHDVLLMRETVGPSMGVKAAGGIRSFKDAMRLMLRLSKTFDGLNIVTHGWHLTNLVGPVQVAWQTWQSNRKMSTCGIKSDVLHVPIRNTMSSTIRRNNNCLNLHSMQMPRYYTFP
jgi:deoxyribose-phosphate aldolase